VVIEQEPASAAARSAIARALRMPDTAFVAPEPTGVWKVHFFSPHEGEMAFCGQGSIAADAVLRRAGLVASDRSIRLLTASGPVLTRFDAERAVSSFELPRDGVRVLPTQVELQGLSGMQTPVTLIDSGRTRAFQRIMDERHLRELSLSAPSVLALCRAHSLSGVCFYSVVAPLHVRLRVFTVSLAGGEDVATGGAVAALSCLLEPGVWQVDQGGGASALERGRLRLDFTALSPTVAVGGAVEIVARGELV
jgi:predicted PhzF superfamily epimerase YddE/YHI9